MLGVNSSQAALDTNSKIAKPQALNDTPYASDQKETLSFSKTKRCASTFDNTSKPSTATSTNIERVRDESGRILFTKQMKREFLLLSAQMLPIHFRFMEAAFRSEGYKFEVLKTTHRAIVDEGLRHVHNDTCYPALLVIGQFIDAVKSGLYDPERIALLITQTGGGCRASNYIHLLRKALAKAGYPDIPVVSLNLYGMEKNPGFKMNYRLLRRLINSLLYGDILMWLLNQTQPYEVSKGESEGLVNRWVNRVNEATSSHWPSSLRVVKSDFKKIVRDFAQIELSGETKPKIGIVGEIYVKYAPLGNNSLEDFLRAEGAEVVVTGTLDFMIFKADCRVEEGRLYGANLVKQVSTAIFKHLFAKCQKYMINAISLEPKFRAPVRFSEIKKMVQGYVGYGNKMGEGWLLTAEMLELIQSGCSGVVCTQPFGCLPNHITGKGMMGLIKRNHPDANIVAIDYDPGASKTNQENRIKLMLSTAKRIAKQSAE